MSNVATELAILDALTIRLAALDHDDLTAIKYPGQTFTEPSGEADIWAEVSMFPNPPSPYAIARGLNDYVGYLQVTVCQRWGQMSAGVLGVAGAIAGHFPEASQFEADGVVITIQSAPGIARLFEDEGRIKAPVIIRYQASA